MADEIDFAEALSRAERDAGQARSSAALQQPGSEECVECGADIPEARRKAAPFALRCVPCQRIHEATHAR